MRIASFLLSTAIEWSGVRDHCRMLMAVGTKWGCVPPKLKYKRDMGTVQGNNGIPFVFHPPQPFSYNASTQLLEGGPFGEVLVCQTWYWVPLQAITHRLCRYSIVCINPLHSLGKGLFNIRVNEQGHRRGCPHFFPSLITPSISFPLKSHASLFYCACSSCLILLRLFS